MRIMCYESGAGLVYDSVEFWLLGIGVEFIVELIWRHR